LKAILHVHLQDSLSSVMVWLKLNICCFGLGKNIIYEYSTLLFLLSSHRWCNGYHARLVCGRSWCRVMVGSKQRQFIASPLVTHHWGIRAWWLGVRIICPSWATWLPADCCFSELTSYKIPTQCVGLLHSGHHHHHHLCKMWIDPSKKRVRLLCETNQNTFNLEVRGVSIIVFNTTFNNISVISRRW